MSRFMDVALALSGRELRRFVRQRGQLYAALARPLLWLVFLGTGMQRAFADSTGVSYVAFLLPGVVAMTVLFGGLISGVTTVWDRELGFMREMLVAPISTLNIVTGKLIAGTVVTTAQAALTLAFAPIAGVSLSPLAALQTLAIAALMSLATVALGLTIAARIDTLEGFGNIANFVALPLFFLSGAMYPIEDVPSWLAPIVAANPITYGVDAMRSVSVGVAHHPLHISLGILSAATIVAVVLAVVTFRREQ